MFVHVQQWNVYRVNNFLTWNAQLSKYWCLTYYGQILECVNEKVSTISKNGAVYE